MTVLSADEAKSVMKRLSKKGGKKGGADGGEVGIPRDVTNDDSGNYVPVLAMECRGLEPYAFHILGNEFKVTSVGGTIYDTDVDLSDGDWGEYGASIGRNTCIEEVNIKISQ